MIRLVIMIMMMMMTAAMNVWVKFYHAWSLGDSAIQCSERSLGRVTLAYKGVAFIAVFAISIWVTWRPVDEKLGHLSPKIITNG